MPPRWVKVCEEIQETELRYADFLHILVDCFMPAVLSALHSDTAQTRVIFGNVEQLLAFSAEFQHALEEALAVCQVGELYKRIAPYYRLYSEYCSNHTEAVTLVTVLSHDNADFRATVQSCEQKHGQGQTLLSLLIMPIQRVPRHILLLEQLCKALPAGDADLEACREALEQMQGVGQQINESIRKKENAVKVWEVQNSLLFDVPRRDDLEPELMPSGLAGEDLKVLLFETHRVFVREGELFKVCNRKVKKRRKFFLFNDCLVYARPAAAMGLRGGKKKWHFRGILQVCKVEDLPNGSPLALGASNAFLVGAISRSVVCIAESETEKLAWMDALRANLVEPPSPSRAAPSSSMSIFTTILGPRGLCLDEEDEEEEREDLDSPSLGAAVDEGGGRGARPNDAPHQLLQRQGHLRHFHQEGEATTAIDLRSVTSSSEPVWASPAAAQAAFRLEAQLQASRERLVAALRTQELVVWAVSCGGYARRGTNALQALYAMVAQEVLDFRNTLRHIQASWKALRGYFQETSWRVLFQIVLARVQALAQNQAAALRATALLLWSSRAAMLWLARVVCVVVWKKLVQLIATARSLDVASTRAEVESWFAHAQAESRRHLENLRAAINGPE